METTAVEKGMSVFLDVFRRADKKDDGKISWEEFVAFFADGVMGKEELRALFEKIDTHNTNFIDPRELCDYFAQHLGQFKEIYALLEELNAKVSDLLVDTSKKYQQSSRTDQFVTRFLMGELMNQICALQHPLDSATEALDQQAKDERTDIVPVQLDDIAKKPAADKIIPGRVVRRAKRQTSSQTSYEGQQALAGTKQALETQVDRLTSLLDRLENRVNFDGIVDEEVDATNDEKLLLRQMDMKIASGQEEAFREGIRNYIEATNAAPGCLSAFKGKSFGIGPISNYSNYLRFLKGFYLRNLDYKTRAEQLNLISKCVTVRSVKDSNDFSMYEVWASQSQQEIHPQTDAGQAFKQSNDKSLEGPIQERSIVIPASWWRRE